MKSRQMGGGNRMTLAEKILHHLSTLPETRQSEVLDFIEFLQKRMAAGSEEDWKQLSLASAMRGMEDETSPYTPADLKESFHG
jgi:hypothetical protein